MTKALPSRIYEGITPQFYHIGKKFFTNQSFTQTHTHITKSIVPQGYGNNFL